MTSVGSPRGRSLFRHVPPTAVRITAGDLGAGLRAVADVQVALGGFCSAMMAETGSRYCGLASSGRAALTFILLGLKALSRRSIVIVPAYSCPTVVQAVLAAGLRPVACDVSPQTLTYEEGALARLLGEEALAVIAVHLYGWAADVRSLLARAHDCGAYLVEDAAQAFGATLDGRMVGTWGDAGLYSLGRGKCLPAGGGGAIVAGEVCALAIDAAIRAQPGRVRLRDPSPVARLAAYGMATHPAGWWFVARSPLNPADAGMRVESLPPIKLGGLSAAAAGVGLSMLSRIGGIRAAWRRNAGLLRGLLAEYPWAAIPDVAVGAEPVYLRLPVVMDSAQRAERAFRALERRGIGVSRSYRRTLPDLYAPALGVRGDAFPGATRLVRNLITLPTNAYVEERDVARIAEALREVHEKGG